MTGMHRERRILVVGATILAVLMGGAPADAGAGQAEEGGAGGGPWAATAKNMLGATTLRRGLCLDLGCGDGRLAAEIARQSEFWVQGLAGDEPGAAQSRRTLLDAGLYGIRAAVTKADLAATGLPDNCARLIVCGDEFVGGRSGRDFKELLRVLNPYGVAVVGQSTTVAKAAGKALTKAELEGWLRGAGITSFDVDEKDGVWARIRKPRPEGWDEWTHRDHDAANTFGSRDDAVRLPLRLQWAGEAPLIFGASARSANMLIAGGRRFVLAPTYKGGGSAWERTVDLTDISPAIHVYDAFTGIQLWKRVGEKEVGLNRDRTYYNPGVACSDMVATDKELFVLGGGVCGVFDAETGAVLRQIGIPADAEPGAKTVWRYVATGGGLLYGAVGVPLKFEFAKYGWNDQGTASAVFALGMEDGKPRWVRKLAAKVNSLVLGGATLFCFDENFTLRATDAATGRELWAKKPFDFPAGSRIARVAFHRDRLWIVYYPADRRGKVVVLSAVDGQVAFQPDFLTQGTALLMTFSGGTAILNARHGMAGTVDRCVAFDADTGKALGAKGGGIGIKCTPTIATPHLLFGRFGFSTGALDLEANRLVEFGSTRPTCGYPMVPAYGMGFLMAPGCGCPQTFRAHLAMAPGQPSAAVAGERLVKGPAFGAVAGAAKATANEWPSWRADIARSGRTAGKPALPWKMLWEKKFPGERLGRLAVSGGLVFLGSSAHRFRALDEANGSERWSMLTEGSCEFSPFAAHGCVYLADDDGWAYCMEATSGRVAWRFRAAPAGDRIIGFGRPMSRWPSGCGVLVNGQTAYFTVGLMPEEGVTVYAVDATSGETRWTRTELATSKKDAMAARGVLAMAGEKLYVPSTWGALTVLQTAGEGGGSDQKMWSRGPNILAVGDTAFAGHTLPIVTTEVVYWREGKALTAEKRSAFAIGFMGITAPLGKNGYVDPKALPPAPLWTAWKDERMTALILAGDTLLSGGDGKVFATDAATGKELWSAPVGARVDDLAFANGVLHAVCGEDRIVCFGK